MREARVELGVLKEHKERVGDELERLQRQLARREEQLEELRRELKEVKLALDREREESKNRGRKGDKSLEEIMAQIEKLKEQHRVELEKLTRRLEDESKGRGAQMHR